MWLIDHTIRPAWRGVQTVTVFLCDRPEIPVALLFGVLMIHVARRTR